MEMEIKKRKQALFFFSDPENGAYLANILIKNHWEIKAPIHNILTLEKDGVDKQHMREVILGRPQFLHYAQHTHYYGHQG